ncbi:MAG: hypothetical protein ACK6A7_06080 [Planctomycetota bacterium]
MGWHNVLMAVLLMGLSCRSLAAGDPPSDRRMGVVLGAAGEELYGEAFRSWGSRWREAAKNFQFTLFDGTRDEATDSVHSQRDAILTWIAQADSKEREHWLILIGHGTHDAKATRFNLKGPDLSTTELGKALEGRPGKWVIIVCSSASAPFLKALAGPDRVVITATKSGSEDNYSRFGDFVSQSLEDPQVDMDHDRNVSVLELFLAASRRVEKYYSEQGLLATEQALIDDNGDGRGTPAAFYRGVRAVKAPAEGSSLVGDDAARYFLASNEHEIAIEDQKKIVEIEDAIESLRKRKGDMDVDAYYGELEILLLQLAGHLSPTSLSEKP